MKSAVKQAGKVVTFYSYKGGVGRSFALANVAVLLSRWGFKVLCVDWDLDAPGLTHYFRPWLPSAGPGLVELIQTVSDAKSSRPDRLDWSKNVYPVSVGGEDPDSNAATLDLMPAGQETPEYVRRVQDLNWSDLYGGETDLGGLLEIARQEWIEAYDFVLIDSRTGITDIGGICTAQMPDILVFCFTANHQSLSGAIDIAKRAAKARNRLPYDRPRILQVPLVCRFDTGEEYERARDWREKFYSDLAEFYDAWTPTQVEPRVLIDHTTIPYFSYWSFGEEIPVAVEDGKTPSLISYYFHTLAALLAHRLNKTDLLVQSRDSFVDSARRQAATKSGFAYKVFISYASENWEDATKLVSSLENRGVSVFLDAADAPVTKSMEPRTERALGESQHMVTLVGDASSRSQDSQLKLFMRQSLDDDGALASGGERTVVPVLLRGAKANRLPSLLRHTHFLTLDSDDALESVTDQIVKAVSQSRAEFEVPPALDAT